MPWRDTLLKYLGPGLLAGITFADWMALLRENRGGSGPWCLPRIAAITWQSFFNSFWRWREERRYGAEIAHVEVPPPLFILGHWRNGTTHLHNLLTIDQRFAFPNNYQVFYPHTFLATERLQSRLLQFFFPRRRPMDNIEWTIGSPQEDEFALLILTGMSPCLGWMFPRRRDHYDQYLTFHRVAPAAIEQWKAEFLQFARKLTWKYRRPLIFKSPPHTARIRLLLQMFPQAKFVHIHRNPYAVFPSTKHTLRVNIDIHQLRRAEVDGLDEYILRNYRAMYDAFFAERGSIPAGHYCEVGFEELEQDPLAVLRAIYTALDLPEFDAVSPAMSRYLESIAGYKKNEFKSLTSDLHERIAKQWRPCFEEWGYPV
jgi:omega-hydroxy-beta-dihydromenaquinone-9 sulfotransferase